MKKQTVFIKRFPSKGEFPKKGNVTFFEKVGNRSITHWFGKYDDDEVTERYAYWLEEIELPSDDEILEAVLMKQDKDQTQFMRGIDFILNKLKGE